MIEPKRRLLRLGTRGSALALRQAHDIVGQLRARYMTMEIEIIVIATTGDRVTDKPLAQIGGAGVFTSAVEAALRAGEIDIAVHSLKDLPTQSAPGVIIGAIPPRADPRDALVSRAGQSLDALPHGATIGTSSRRRAAQIRHYRRDLYVVDIRGNVDTRLAKAHDAHGVYDAILLARAGLERLERADAITESLPFDVMLPAPGQAALAVQCRDEAAWRDLLHPLHDAAAGAAVTAERAFLSGLGGGCSLPVGAHAHIDGAALHLRGRVTAFDGSAQIDVEGMFPAGDPSAAGTELAAKALAQGVLDLLKDAE
ncbi:MAG: hydroxymethylbilane synthase [Chloroflexota bacterium]|nr:hydroxymethylbilane synthase [Chloroflexota bacterium]